MALTKLSAEDRLINDGLVKDFTSGDESLVKQASVDVTGYIRLKLRENGIFRRIISPVTVGKEDLDRSQISDLPQIIMDYEAESNGAMVLPFGMALPEGDVMNAGRFTTYFGEVTSRKYEIELIRLMTYNIDLRAMIESRILKDVMDVEDTQFFNSINEVCDANAYSSAATAGTWFQSINVGTWSRNSLKLSRQGLQQGPGKLIPALQVMNDVSILEFQAFGRDVAGGDLAQQTLFGDATIDQTNGVKILVTNKRDLVANDTVYHFAPEDFIGTFFVLNDVQMISDVKDAKFLTFFAREVIGSTIANTASFTRSIHKGTNAEEWVKSPTV